MLEMTSLKTAFCRCALLAVLLFTGACKAAPEPKPAGAPSQAPFALETFDLVWEKIHEHHFDTNYNGHDWLEVRKTFRPRAAQARDTRELRDVLQEMLDLLHVSHMAIVPGEVSAMVAGKKGQESSSVEQADEEESGTVGIEVRFLKSDLLVTRVEPESSAERAGVKPGWLVRRIGGKEVQKILPDNLGKLDEQRRRFLTWRAAAKKLMGPPGSTVAVEFEDGADQPRDLKLERVRAAGESVQFGSLPPLHTHFSATEVRTAADQRVGLIKFDIWMLPTALAFNRAIDRFRETDGMVIDLRGNIGGLVGMIIGTAGHFLREPVNLGALVARDNTFQLPANPRFVGASGQAVTPFPGPVAVLVDEITASASEVFTGGMQEIGRVRVFGRRTSGQALPALLDDLPNGDAFYHPISDFVTPKGTRFEGRGVIPDEDLPLNRAALLAGKDADLDAALAWIARQAAPKK